MGLGSLIEVLHETSLHPVVIVPLILCHRLLIATRNSHQHRHFPPPMFDMTVCKGEIGPLIMPVARNIPPVALIPSISFDGNAKLRIHYLVFIHIQKYNQSRCRRIHNLREFAVVRNCCDNITGIHRTVYRLAHVVTPQSWLA
jgi:hypothetical protein